MQQKMDLYSNFFPDKKRRKCTEIEKKNEKFRVNFTQIFMIMISKGGGGILTELLKKY